MRFDNYTPEVFVENFLKDSEVFGINTAKAIYEEVFSTICNKKIKLDGFVNELCEEINSLTDEELTEDDVSFVNNTNIPQFDKAAEKFNNYLKAIPDDKKPGIFKTVIGKLPKAEEASEAITNAADSVANTAGTAVKGGLLMKLAGFLKGLPEKVKTFFGGLQGKSFGEIMKSGLGWLQANPALALKSAGGLALVLMLIKALKKKGELNRYGQLAAIEARRNQLQEDCYDTVLGDSAEKETVRKVLKECETNRRLRELVFEDTRKETKERYMNY